MLQYSPQETSQNQTHFACVGCGRCCHGLGLTLSLAEARHWMGKGHEVEMWLEAVPWDPEAPNGDEAQKHLIASSFPMRSGAVSFRVLPLLVAAHGTPCPYLLSDQTCGNYNERPSVCRIYPLERRPFIRFETDRKLCPTEAWSPTHAVLLADGEPVAEQDRDLIASHRTTLVEDIPLLAALCKKMAFNMAALRPEGVVTYPLPPAILQQLSETEGLPAEEPTLTLVSNRHSTLKLFEQAGCYHQWMPKGARYLASFDDDYLQSK